MLPNRTVMMRDRAAQVAARLHFFESNNSRRFLEDEFPTPGPWSDTAGYIFCNSQLGSVAAWAEKLEKSRFEKSQALKNGAVGKDFHTAPFCEGHAT